MTEGNGGNAQAGSVKCPACGSEHSADGGTLIKRSARLVELEKADGELDRLEKEFDKLEKKLADAKKTKPAPAPEPQPQPPAKAAETKPAEKKRGFFGREPKG